MCIRDRLEKAFLCIDFCDADMLVYLFHFIILRFRFQVAEHDTVHYELTVVGRIAEVTAISKVAFAVGGIDVYKRQLQCL